MAVRTADVSDMFVRLEITNVRTENTIRAAITVGIREQPVKRQHMVRPHAVNQADADSRATMVFVPKEQHVRIYKQIRTTAAAAGMFVIQVKLRMLRL